MQLIHNQCLYGTDSIEAVKARTAIRMKEKAAEEEKSSAEKKATKAAKKALKASKKANKAAKKAARKAAEAGEALAAEQAKHGEGAVAGNQWLNLSAKTGAPTVKMELTEVNGVAGADVVIDHSATKPLSGYVVPSDSQEVPHIPKMTERDIVKPLSGNGASGTGAEAIVNAVDQALDGVEPGSSAVAAAFDNLRNNARGQNLGRGQNRSHGKNTGRDN